MLKRFDFCSTGCYFFAVVDGCEQLARDEEGGGTEHPEKKKSVSTTKREILDHAKGGWREEEMTRVNQDRPPRPSQERECV